jgi:FtsH-binding integral membrane protein
MGGKRYGLTMDDYIIAALMIYLDIIMIFLYIL